MIVEAFVSRSLNIFVPGPDQKEYRGETREEDFGLHYGTRWDPSTAK